MRAVLFDLSLPVVTRNARFQFGPKDVPQALQLGTLLTVVAKLCSGYVALACGRACVCASRSSR